MNAFDNKKYIEAQKQAFIDKIDKCTKLYVEVGGKLIQDRHAARVLPGYDENQKINFIKELFNNDFELIYTISAENIVNAKIRDDFSTTYLEETFRLIDEFKKFGVEINNIIISKFKEHSDILDNFVKKVKNLGKNVFYLNYINHYSLCNEFLEEFDKQPLLNINKKHIVVTGPGGGSGKFAFCLSQLYNEMKKGEIPQYIKYESFPVHDLDINHPVNLAYAAATADLNDKVLEDKYKSGSISYNRDMDNFELLKLVANKFDKEGSILRKIGSPTDMGINFIKAGIVDDKTVRQAASIEVFRRFLKSKDKYLSGKENNVCMDRIRKIVEFIMDN